MASSYFSAGSVCRTRVNMSLTPGQLYHVQEIKGCSCVTGIKIALEVGEDKDICYTNTNCFEMDL